MKFLFNLVRLMAVGFLFQANLYILGDRSLIKERSLFFPYPLKFVR
ncbi:hypothetical protein [Pleurocapsa sp. FMAR1]|nr:hypothetical protein [Pleurocapsa sp. FMAR1]